MESFLRAVARKSAVISARWQARQAGRALRRSADELRYVSELVDLAFRFNRGGIQIAPMQVRSEIAALLEILAKRGPRRILEIGSARGGTFFLLSRVAAADAHLITIDLPDRSFSTDSVPWRSELVRSLSQVRQRVDVISADSQLQETAEWVKELLRGKLLDLLFIDGDHRYEGVRRDFHLYAPLVCQEGLIAIHDIVPGEEKYVGGVPRFWREISEGRPSRTLVENWEQGGYGIGLLEKDR